MYLRPGILVLAHLARFGFVAALVGRWMARSEPARSLDIRRLDGAGTLGGYLAAMRPAVLAGSTVVAAIVATLGLGEDLFADLMVGERLVRAKLNGQARPAEHSTVKIALDAGALHVFDRQTGARL
jgi:hypothetical protein